MKKKVEHLLLLNKKNLIKFKIFRKNKLYLTKMMKKKEEKLYFL